MFSIISMPETLVLRDSIELECKKRYLSSVEIDLEDYVRPVTSTCFSNFGLVGLRNHNELSMIKLSWLNPSETLKVILKPKITTTDDSLRSLSAEK